MRCWLRFVLPLACVLAGGCAAPVPSYDAYRHAALITATSMAGDLASAGLAARLGLRGMAWSAFVSDNVTNAENDADAVSSVFTSRQPPPGPSSARLAHRLSADLSAATTALTSLRVAVRHEDVAQVRRALTAVARLQRRFLRLEQELQ
jgi:hypothetical protein